jgi:hypothetical protein
MPGAIYRPHAALSDLFKDEILIANGDPGKDFRCLAERRIVYRAYVELVGVATAALVAILHGWCYQRRRLLANNLTLEMHDQFKGSRSWNS